MPPLLYNETDYPRQADEESDLEDLHPSLDDLKMGRKTNTADGLAEHASPFERVPHGQKQASFLGGYKEDYDTLYLQKSPFDTPGSSPLSNAPPLSFPNPNDQHASPSVRSELFNLAKISSFDISFLMALFLLVGILVVVALLFRMIRVAGQRRKQAQYALVNKSRGSRELGFK